MQANHLPSRVQGLRQGIPGAESWRPLVFCLRRAAAMGAAPRRQRFASLAGGQWRLFWSSQRCSMACPQGYAGMQLDCHGFLSLVAVKCKFACVNVICRGPVKSHMLVLSHFFCFKSLTVQNWLLLSELALAIFTSQELPKRVNTCVLHERRSRITYIRTIDGQGKRQARGKELP
jgi:hypothetical protein